MKQELIGGSKWSLDTKKQPMEYRSVRILSLNCKGGTKGQGVTTSLHEPNNSIINVFGQSVSLLQ